MTRRGSRAPRLEAMAGALVHRGPDGLGFFVDDAHHDIGLTHTRLSIIDLAGGQQPIGNEDGSVQVVFNGEIFNFIELREDLIARGHHVRTRTDTEVIAHLYEEEGDDFVHRLNGQFAIALWDARRRRLMLIRDRPGILPLYYTRRPGELVFGSELKAVIAALPRQDRPGINPDALRQVMSLWAPLSPDTSVEGVFEVEPGQILVVSHGGMEARHYWRWTPAPEGEGRQGDPDELADELLSLLDDATQIRLRADVPVGAYLSGGLDSSLLTALAVRAAGGQLRTFSIGFDDRALDESGYQRQMIDFIGADHSHVTCTQGDVSARVRQSGFKVVLTGEGADEVFGGYDLFKEAKIRAFCARERSSRFRPSLLKRLYPYLDFTRMQSVAVLKNYFGAIDDDPASPMFSHGPRWSSGPWRLPLQSSTGLAHRSGVSTCFTGRRCLRRGH